MHEKFRVRIPILKKWENMAEVFACDAGDLYDDYIFPLAKDVNVFSYSEHESGTMLAVTLFSNNSACVEFFCF